MKSLIINIFLLLHLFNNPNFAQESNYPIFDSDYTFNQAVDGIEIPKSIIKQLILLDVEYYSFDDKLHKGQVVINKKAVKDIKEIFNFIKDSGFPIAKAVPIVKYNWSDDQSMRDNNTSAFNYRKVKGQKVISPHSYGMAIDLNPLFNPHIKGKKVQPANGKYDTKVVGTILRDSKLVKEFIKRGWQWGGTWRSSNDYQHFEKK